MSCSAIVSVRATSMLSTATRSMLADLRRLKLLSDESIRGIEVALRTEPETPEGLTPLLLAAGLTEFQAQVALAGQAPRLVFGGFVLLDKIGEGGMGAVYRALQPRIGRVEALKVIRSDKVGSSTVAKRFLREIQLTSSLEHPNIVRAYDAGEVNDQLYLATEYVPGTDLASFVNARGPMSVADACTAGYQITLALQHIHEKGLVHRDLKPSNLIRDNTTGTVKVLDLGLSGFNRSVLDQGTGATLTRDGVVLGTPDFMAPEQVQDPHRVDIRADLYSLGCTLYFLLTGDPPFGGTPVEKLYSHGYVAPPALKLPGGATPPAGLAEVISRLMAKKPEDRFQTPGELLAALLAIRPGSEDSGGVTIAHLVAVPVPAEKSDEFAHLLSHGDSAADLAVPTGEGEEPVEGEEPDETAVPWLGIVATAAAMFSAGLMASALYFSGWLKW